MWILMTKTYAGPEGIFAKGLRFDLPRAKCALLAEKGRKCWKATCAPWDDQVDREAVKLAEAGQGYEIAVAKAAQLSAQAEEFRQRADACVTPVAALQALAVKAEAEAAKAVEIAERKQATDNQKRKAWGLVREHEKAHAVSELATAKMRVLMAEYALKRLEADDADKEAKRLANQLGIEAGESRDEHTEGGEVKPADPADDNESEGPSVPDGQQPGLPNEVTEHE